MLFPSPPLTVARAEAWLEGLLLQLALAVLAGDLKNALLHCRLGLSGVVLPTVPDPQKPKTGMERSGPTLTAFRRAGWPDGPGPGHPDPCAHDLL